MSWERFYYGWLLVLIGCLVIVDGLSSSSSSLLSSTYCVNLKCVVKPERTNEFLSLIRSNQYKTLHDEQKSLQYTVGSDGTATTFFLHEQFINANGFEEHRKAPHNADWQNFKSTQPFIGTPITFFYHSINAHSTGEKILPSSKLHYCIDAQITYCNNNNNRNDILTPLLSRETTTTTSDDLIQSVWGESIDDPNIILLHQEYTSSPQNNKDLEQKLDELSKQGHLKVVCIDYYETIPSN